MKYRQPSDEIAVNVGSNCYFQSDASGLTWLPDQPYREGSWGYIGGKAIQTQKEILLTSDVPLYQTMREGMQAYRFDVPIGSYEVELLSVDSRKSQASSAYLLGRQDTRAGGVALRRRYFVDNSDGYLLLAFGVHDCLSGIKIRKL